MAKRRTPPPPAPRPVPARGTPWLPGIVLVLATVLAYLPALAAGFIWDDDAYVTRNGALRDLGGLWRIWTAPGATPQYYPMTFTTFWVEYHLWGLAPAGYHFVNVALHAANAVLVWRILAALSVPGALIAAAIFALHPVQVESVAWITERKNVLSGLFYLAALLVYFRRAPRTLRSDIVCLALFAAALFSKTVTCSLPAAILLILWWRDGAIARRDWRAVAPLFVLGALLASVTIWMERSHVGAVGADWHLSFVDRCLIAGRALWFYAATLVWPANLAFVYPRWQIDAGAWSSYLYPAAAVAVVGAAFLLRARLGRGPLTALLYFGGTLLPALGFFDVFPMRYSFVADHYQYLACLGLVVLAAAGLDRASGRGRAPAVAAAVALVLAPLTWRQTQAYADPRTLWLDTLANNPGAWMAHNNLGLLLQQEGRPAEAVPHFEAAVRLKPDDDFALNNLGNALYGLGRPEEAVARFRAALAANPNNAEAHANLGNMLAGEGDLKGAEAHLREAVRIAPGQTMAHNNLANVLALQGRGEEALREYETALRLDPGYAEAHHNLAVLLAANEQRGAAIEHLDAAVRLAPGYAEAHYKLGLLLAADGRRGAALASLQRAVELADTPQYRDALARVRNAP